MIYKPNKPHLVDGEYIWPEGFSHYVSAHNVKPDDEFIEHVFKKIANG